MDQRSLGPGVNTNARNGGSLQFSKSYFLEKARNVWKYRWQDWRPYYVVDEAPGKRVTVQAAAGFNY
jgi:hypothetical protein